MKHQEYFEGILNDIFYCNEYRVKEIEKKFGNSVKEYYERFYNNYIELVNNGFKNLLKSFCDISNTTFLDFNENETKALRAYFGIPEDAGVKSYAHLKNDEYGINNPSGLFSKFKNRFFIYLNSLISDFLFSFERPGEQSITLLEPFFSIQNYGLLKKLGYKSVQDITRLTTDDLKSNWLKYAKIAYKIIDVLHSLGFTFSDEVGIYDESMSTLVYILKQKKNEILNSCSQISSSSIETEYLFARNDCINYEMFGTQFYDAVLVKKK